MMCSLIEDLLPPSYFSSTLLGVQTDQRVLRQLIVQYLPALDRLLQEHDIGKREKGTGEGRYAELQARRTSSILAEYGPEANNLFITGPNSNPKFKLIKSMPNLNHL